MSIEGGPRDDEQPEAPKVEVSAEARAEFTAAQRVGTFHAFERGRAVGIPADELEAYVRGVVAEHVAMGGRDVAVRILRNTGIGTDAEIAAFEAAVIAPSTESMEESEQLPVDVEIAATATFAELRDVLAHHEGFAEALRDELPKFMRPDDAAAILTHLTSGSSDRVVDAFARAGLSREEVAYYFFLRIGE